MLGVKLGGLMTVYSMVPPELLMLALVMSAEGLNRSEG